MITFSNLVDLISIFGFSRSFEYTVLCWETSTKLSRLYGNPTNNGGDADIDNDDAERWNEFVYEFTQPNETYAHVHVHYFFFDI